MRDHLRELNRILRHGDARGALSVSSRADYIAGVRRMVHKAAQLYLKLEDHLHEAGPVADGA